MTYTKKGDDVTIEMNQADYAVLMFLLGAAASALTSMPDARAEAIRFIDELNRDDPTYIRFGKRK